MQCRIISRYCLSMLAAVPLAAGCAVDGPTVDLAEPFAASDQPGAEAQAEHENELPGADLIYQIDGGTICSQSEVRMYLVQSEVSNTVYDIAYVVVPKVGGTYDGVSFAADTEYWYFYEYLEDDLVDNASEVTFTVLVDAEWKDVDDGPEYNYGAVVIEDANTLSGGDRRSIAADAAWDEYDPATVTIPGPQFSGTVGGNTIYVGFSVDTGTGPTAVDNVDWLRPDTETELVFGTQGCVTASGVNPPSSQPMYTFSSTSSLPSSGYDYSMSEPQSAN